MVEGKVRSWISLDGAARKRRIAAGRKDFFLVSGAWPFLQPASDRKRKEMC